MIISDTSFHNIPPAVQVQQAAIPPPAEMPFLAAPMRNHTAFHSTHFSRHALLRPIARETGSKIYLQEEPICGFWYLNHGVVGLHHTLENGKEMLVRACQQGDWFGYLGLFGSEFYHCHACVLQTASLCHVIPHSNSDFLRYHPQFTQFLLNQVVASLSDSEHRMTWIARYRTRHRVLSSLWYLTQYFPGYDWTWREVAEFAGCETETALRFSKELRQASILDDSQRRLHVLHPARLLTLLDNSIIAPKQ
ncbi:Crp/Fnr family transcriptional regulator [Salmonella enterica]|uniref:DNA-binding transcriptional dual regulator Crp n=2 Tax=Salmonella enterica TaxID=28901 RepID=A0A379QPB7_SALER|nr:Crp/Fnr family transcriptional regulator [Salmonella enterica]ECC1479597.1 Crp/Fnr family transcriptional regulator [Salmonella enterica subsp. salamae]ASG89813.1 cyclic nucleotide-binding protein [Salmonella enterica subsp. salamae serovar 55:k:z39 str. 1315K]ECC1654186.1 Crp/Fnr family transcriptional regulator [Salmonella enterica subsp. salamae]ECD9412633.1 Crp/Fnr family transcriptional regulator [Salmonella enterica subsp. salamae]ECF5929433.1 Crp/Fnr family transcriptional regulator 